LYAAASDVTIERVRAPVRQVGPESPTVEYKQQMAETIAKGVAALANTYGGLLLVGVADDRTVRGSGRRPSRRSPTIARPGSNLPGFQR
jgi:predicted HTH transcriptional regulator